MATCEKKPFFLRICPTLLRRHCASQVAWALRELRPVAYRFRAGAEAKYTRFGFIADELERVLPELVRAAQP